MSDDGKKVQELVDGIPIAMVTTRNRDGLCGRPLAVQRVDDDGTLWFLVDRHADWVGLDLGVANVAFSSDTTWVSATGAATTTADRAVLDDLGDPITDTWFEDGAEPIALRVAVDHADWWDAPGRLRQALELAGAKLRGHQPDMGDRGVAEP
jgi:general stress protein 26